MSFFMRSLTAAAMTLLCTAALAGAAESTDPGQIFGIGQGYVHPSLAVTGKYSDNYDQDASNEKGDWTTTISPGIWLALPATERKVVSIVTSNDAPGGQGVSRFQGEDFTGLQGSLLYRADIESNDKNKDDDSTKHKGQGVLQYSFAGGLTLEVSDVYTKDYDDQAKTGSTKKEEFTSNLANAIVYYKVGPKLKLRAGYSNYTLDYQTSSNLFKERTDDQVSAYMLYRVLPKTELFLQYDYIDLDYDKDILGDTEENHVFAGVKFDSNARISGHLKAGYGRTSVDVARNDIYEDLIGDASLRYGFLERSSISLTGRQRVNVSTELPYQNILHRKVGLSFSQPLAHKLGVVLSTGYARDEYRVDSENTGRLDHTFTAGIKFNYDVQKWLRLSLGYDYTDRDSDIESDEYRENTVLSMISATF